MSELEKFLDEELPEGYELTFRREPHDRILMRVAVITDHPRRIVFHDEMVNLVVVRAAAFPLVIDIARRSMMKVADALDKAEHTG